MFPNVFFFKLNLLFSVINSLLLKLKNPLEKCASSLNPFSKKFSEIILTFLAFNISSLMKNLNLSNLYNFELLSVK